MSNKKYEFTGETCKVFGVTLKRIKRLSDGLVGGLVESELNLSHDGDCFIYGNAKVYGNASVYGNAKVYGNAEVYGQARVYGNAKVCGNAEVYGQARVYGYARVYENAEVYGYARVYGNAEVYGQARVCGNAEVYDHTRVGMAFDKFYYHNSSDPNVRGVTVVVKDGVPYFTIGCQHNISLEMFLHRIHNEDGGLEKNPHRAEYLKVLKMYEEEK